MTTKEARETCPNIKVVYPNGRKDVCATGGRLNTFATVYIGKYGESTVETTWENVAKLASSGGALII